MIRYLIFFITLLFFRCSESQKSQSLNPVIPLNGTWKINITPAGDYWKNDDFSTPEWRDIQVPGEAMMQGFATRHDQPFVYRKRIDIPAGFAGKDIILQFDGVYSYARVWVNGHFVRDHSGGFTRWDCDITPFAKAGETAVITVEVTDKPDEVSYGSGYAKHPIGGILRSVRLLALPHNFHGKITIITDLDEQYRDATLTVKGKLNNPVEGATVHIELRDRKGEKVMLQQEEVWPEGDGTFEISNLIASPEKWTSENPVLYTLKVIYSENGQILYQKEHKTGFREIEVQGNKLLVNGIPVKLRGACRHDIHPLLGRVSTPEYERKDVRLAKEANINFIRTSHYPPTDNFLSLCDEYGIYVEDETAVCFVGSHRTKDYVPGASQSDPAFTKRYLSQLEEMVTAHRNHPSVIIWSIGNENEYGSNFKRSYDWVKENDPTRPVIFSYPGKVPVDEKAYDILSMHYPGIDGSMNQYGITTKNFGHEKMPVIFDEWAHVACYNNNTIREDPNVRNFWGRSLDMMWHGVFQSDGGLGGAIWGMIDETFMLPDTLPGFGEWWGKVDKRIIPAEYTGKNVGYGEWGIIDTWRRKKPEFWNVKKAYSPIRLQNTNIGHFDGRGIRLRVENRFDHTNLNEVTARYKWGEGSGEFRLPDIKPHADGMINQPVSGGEKGEDLVLEFWLHDTLLIDKYYITLWEYIKQFDKKKDSIPPVKKELMVEEQNIDLKVKLGNNVRIIFDKRTGMIQSIEKPADTISISGPMLNLRTKGKAVIYSNHLINDYFEAWKINHFSYKNDTAGVTVYVRGALKKIRKVSYVINISPEGMIKVEYEIDGMPEEHIRELGVRFLLSEKIDSLSWQRKRNMKNLRERHLTSHWNYYPPGHLSAIEGKAALYASVVNKYRQPPAKGWVYDTKSFYYNGTKDEAPGERLTFIAKATKENILRYGLHGDGHEILTVLGSGDVSCRIEKKGENIMIFMNNLNDYIDLSWGNYQRNIMPEKTMSGTVTFSINAE